MKTSWVAILFLAISTTINAEEITLFKGNYLAFGIFGDMQNGALEFRFNSGENIYYLYYRIAGTETPVWIGLTENDLAIFRNNLKKFIEWDAIARRENANVTNRELPDSVINAASVKEGDGYGPTAGGVVLALQFLFSTDTLAAQKAGRPLLYIVSNKVFTRARSTDTVSIQVQINLTGTQAQSLLDGIKPDKIESVINRAKSQSDLFN